MMKNYFGDNESMLFHQKPDDRIGIRQTSQENGSGQVMMIGDRLNDAGALRQVM